MSHITIILRSTVLPPPGAAVAAETTGEMTAEVTYTPPDNATVAQIGSQVERIVKRLTKLADD